VRWLNALVENKRQHPDYRTAHNYSQAPEFSSISPLLSANYSFDGGIMMQLRP
jgi:hypothetical protein